MEFLLIRGLTFQILETIKSTPFGKEEKIVMYNDRVGLLHKDICIFIEGVEEWLQDTRDGRTWTRWIQKENQISIIKYLEDVLVKMKGHKRSQTLYGILDKDDYYNSLILAC